MKSMGKVFMGCPLVINKILVKNEEDKKQDSDREEYVRSSSETMVRLMLAQRSRERRKSHMYVDATEGKTEFRLQMLANE